MVSEDRTFSIVAGKRDVNHSLVPSKRQESPTVADTRAADVGEKLEDCGLELLWGGSESVKPPDEGANRCVGVGGGLTFTVRAGLCGIDAVDVLEAACDCVCMEPFSRKNTVFRHPLS
jgi:hypothetical protein